MVQTLHPCRKHPRAPLPGRGLTHLLIFQASGSSNLAEQLLATLANRSQDLAVELKGLVSISGCISHQTPMPPEQRLTCTPDYEAPCCQAPRGLSQSQRCSVELGPSHLAFVKNAEPGVDVRLGEPLAYPVPSLALGGQEAWLTSVL